MLKVTHLDIPNSSLILGHQTFRRSWRLVDPEEFLALSEEFLALSEIFLHHYKKCLYHFRDTAQCYINPIEGCVDPIEPCVHPGGEIFDAFGSLVDAHDDRSGALVNDNRVLGLLWGGIDFESLEQRIKRFHTVGFDRVVGALASRSNGVGLGGLRDLTSISSPQMLKTYFSCW